METTTQYTHIERFVRLPHGFPPTSDNWFQVMPTEMLVLILIALILIGFILVLFSLHVFLICKSIKNDYNRFLLLAIASSIAVTSICSGISVCVPRALLVVEPFAYLYFSSSLVAFVFLIERIFGGLDKMSEELMNSEMKINLRTFPVCCCCVCLPQMKPSKRTLQIIRWMTIQGTIVRFILIFIILVIKVDDFGFYQMNVVMIPINIIITLSTLSAIYGCILLMNIASAKRSQFAISKLFCIIQVMLITINLGGPIFGLFGKYGIIPDDHIMGHEFRSSVYHNLFLIVVYFLLAAFLTFILKSVHKHGTEDEESEEKGEMLAVN